MKNLLYILVLISLSTAHSTLGAAEMSLHKNKVAVEKAHEILKNYEKELAEDPNNIRLLKALGESYYSLGEYKNAERYLVRALHLSPNDPSIKTTLGLAYLFTDDLDLSQTLLESALKDDQKNPDILSGLGRIAQLQFKFQKADELYQEALKINPNSPITIEFLGTLRLQQKRYGEAQKIFDQLKSQELENEWIDQDILKARLGPAVEEIKQIEATGNINQAASRYQELLKANPQFIELYLNLGKAYAKMELYREALNVYERGLMLFPKSEALQVNMGYAYLESSDFIKSEEIFNKVLKINPKNAEAIAGLGRIKELMGYNSEAKKLYNKALRISPYNSTALTFSAELALKEHQYDEAKQSYTKLLTIYPEANWVLQALATTKLGPYMEKIQTKEKQKEYRAVEKLYQQLIQFMPDDADVYYKFGQFYHSIKQDNKAIEIYQQGLDINHANSNLRIGLGFSYLAENELNEAEKAFQSVIKIDPNNTDAIVGMGKIAELEEDYKEAELMYRKALVINKNSITALSGLGNLRMKQDRFREAQRIFESIKRIDPISEWVDQSIEDAKFSPILKEIKESEGRNDYDTAEMLYLQLIAESPKTAYYYIGLGDLYIQINRAEDAVNLYQDGLKAIPKSTILQTAMGYAYISLNNLNKARRIFQDVLIQEPENSDAAAGLGRIAEMEGDSKYAFKYYKQALENDPNNTVALTYMGNLLLKEKKYKQAKEIYLKLKWLLPNSVWVSYRLQDIYYAPLLDKIQTLEQFDGLSQEQIAKNKAEAEKLFQQLISKAKNNPEYYFKFGQLYMQMERYPDAVQVYQRGLDINPEANYLRSALGFAYMGNKDFAKAQEEFQEVLNNNPQNPEALAGLGKLAELNNKMVEALKFYDKALNIDPNNITTLAQIAGFQAKEGHYDKAKELYNKLLGLESNTAWVHKALAEIETAPYLNQIRSFEDEDEFEQAAEVYATLIASGDNRPDTFLDFGYLLIKLERYKDAITILREGLRKNPSSNRLKINLGHAYILNDNLDEAEITLQEALETEPENPDTLAYLGQIESLSDRPKKAEKYYDEALKINPESIIALSLYGELLLQQKRFEEADLVYQRLFELDPKAAWVRRALKISENGPELEGARVLTNLGMNRCAKEKLIGVIGNLFDDPSYYLLLGDVYVNMERYNEAISVYRTGLEVEPGHAGLLRAIGNTYIIQNKPCCAYSIFSYLLQKDPKDANSWAGMGRTFALFGCYYTAQAYYAVALDLEPDNEMAWTNFATDEEERQRYFSARNLFGFIVNNYPGKCWIEDRYYANYRRTHPLLSLLGKYYEEDEWDRHTKKWVARYQVYGSFMSILYPMNNKLWIGATSAFDFYRLINQQDHFTYYFFDVARAHAVAKYVFNPCLYTDMRLGVSVVAPYREEQFAQNKRVAVEPTLSFTYHTPRTNATFGISSDTDLVARNFNTNTAELVSRYYTFGSYSIQPQNNVYWGIEGGYYYINGFHDNQFQRARSWIFWTPDIFCKIFTFRYHFLYQNFNKVIPDYYTYAPQLTHHLQIELRKACSEWSFITVGYAHGWQSTRTRFANIIINQPLVLQPLFWDRRDYNQGFIRASYDHCPWQIGIDADFYRDSKKYTIWHVYLNMSYIF